MEKTQLPPIARKLVPKTNLDVNITPQRACVPSLAKPPPTNVSLTPRKGRGGGRRRQTSSKNQEPGNNQPILLPLTPRPTLSPDTRSLLSPSQKTYGIALAMSVPFDIETPKQQGVRETITGPISANRRGLDGGEVGIPRIAPVPISIVPNDRSYAQSLGGLQATNLVSKVCSCVSSAKHIPPL